ncbi:MAG TPA: tripartite tricarboxylate transporter substrate binding protein [Alphaproteobacteria bacterium]
MNSRCLHVVFGAVLGLGAGLLTGTGADAQPYPSRPVKIIVPNPPGGATDTTSRIVGARLSELFGQPVVVENRPGSAGTLANEVTAKASPDGYTIMLGQDSQIVINPYLYTTSTIEPLKDFVPVASLVTTVLILTVNPSLPVKDFHGFVEHARHATPPLAYASIGSGSQHHLAMEMLKMRAGINLVHVPYKGGGPAAAALIANEVAAEFGGNSTASQVKQGVLRGLAVTSLKRDREFPDLPTIGDTYPGFEVTPWLGFFAPAGVPAPIIAKLHDTVNRVLTEPAVVARFEGGGMAPFVTTPAEFAAFIKAEDVKYRDIVKAVGARID